MKYHVAAGKDLSAVRRKAEDILRQPAIKNRLETCSPAGVIF
jgi:hypothetical protein